MPIEKLCPLSVALAVGMPLLCLACIHWSLVRRAAFVLLISATAWYTLPLAETSILWDATYRGSTRGLTFGLSDALVLALAVALWVVRARVKRWPRGSWLFFALLAWFVGTGLFAERRDYVLFEMGTLVRAYALYWVLVNYFEEFGELRLLLGTLVGVVFLQAAVGVQQHLTGGYRATGTLGDPNLLGMFLNMVLAILLAVGMESRGKWQGIGLSAFGAGAMLLLITYSRGAWLVAAGTSVLVVVSLLLLNCRVRKFAVLIPVATGCMLLIMARAESIADRWQEGLATVTDAYVSARTLGPALAMVHDYPVTGLGLNNISYALNTRSYGDELMPDERQVIHNLYAVTAAETGLVGLALFVALGMSWLVRGARVAWQGRRSGLVGALAVGATGSLFSVAVHSGTEWVARVIVIAQTVAMVAALIASLQEAPERSALRQEAEAW